MNEVAPRPSNIDAAWMTRVLERAGVLNGAAVSGLRFEGVGHGMMSDSFRFHLTYDRADPALPASVVGKFAAADPTSKATATTYRVYRTEVGFYRDIAPALAANVPYAYHAELDEETDDFTIIMADLAEARLVDEVSGGCSIKDAGAALSEAARLHGSRWADSSLERLPWMVARRAANEMMLQALPGVFDGFLERYADMLEAEYRDVVRRVLPAFLKMSRDERAVRTLQHGDYRLDNLLFDVGGRRGSVHILDWGTVNFASGLSDVSYFIGASLKAGQRREHEHELVRHYYETLAQFDIGSYGWQDCWNDYRRFCFLGMFTAVAAPMTVERSERSDRLFMQMVRSYSEQIRDLGSLAYWE